MGGSKQQEVKKWVTKIFIFSNKSLITHM